MIFAETPRFRLRQWRRDDLARTIELIGAWDVAKWLVHVPYPYLTKDAETFYALMDEAYRRGQPELFVIADKNTDEKMGAVGLHVPNTIQPEVGSVEIGYWLGVPYWGKGIMSEAVALVLAIAFKRPDVQRVVSSTDPTNHASQNVLRKAGLNYLGIFPRDGIGLRGSDTITRWQLTREEYEKLKAP